MLNMSAAGLALVAAVAFAPRYGRRACRARGYQSGYDAGYDAARQSDALNILPSDALTIRLSAPRTGGRATATTTVPPRRRTGRADARSCRAGARGRLRGCRPSRMGVTSLGVYGTQQLSLRLYCAGAQADERVSNYGQTGEPLSKRPSPRALYHAAQLRCQ